MSRQRFIYPEIWHSEQIMALSLEARLLFIGIFSTADDEGRRKASPMCLMVDLMPADNVVVESVLRWRDEIADRGLIRLYKDKRETEILDIPTWHDYQKPRHTKDSKFPAFPGSDDSGTIPHLPALDGETPSTNGEPPSSASSGSGSGSGSGCGSTGVPDANASAPPVETSITAETAGLVRSWLPNGHDFRHVNDLWSHINIADASSPVWMLATCMEIQKAGRIKDKAAALLRRFRPTGLVPRKTPDKYMKAAAAILNGPPGDGGQPVQLGDALKPAAVKKKGKR